MSTKLPNAEILIPITAQNFDVEVLEVKNLFMFPDKKQKLLHLCSSVGINPVDITADSVHFRRRNIKAVVAFMQQIGLKPLMTQEADVSSVRQVSDAFDVTANYNGSINLTLTTPDGTASLATNIDVQNIDDADASKLLRILKNAAAVFNKPMNVNIYNNEPAQGPMAPVQGPIEPSKALVPYVEPSQVEDFRKDLQASMEQIGYFKEYAITMDNLPKPVGTEVKKSYATAITITFPDGKTVKTSLVGAATAPVLSRGDVLVGPHPKFLPLQAGIVKYTIVDVTPSTVSFTVAHKGQNLHNEAYKLTRDQFDDLSDLYHVKKQSTTAFNVMKKEAIKKERDNDVVKTIENKPEPTAYDKAAQDNIMKAKEKNQILPKITKVGESLSKDVASPPPRVTPPNLPKHMQEVKSATEKVAPVRLFSSLGLW